MSFLSGLPIFRGYVKFPGCTYVYVFRHLHFWAFSGSPKSWQKLVDSPLSLKFYAYHSNGSLEDVYYIKVTLYIYIYFYVFMMFSYFLQRFNILHAMIISLAADYSPKKTRSQGLVTPWMVTWSMAATRRLDNQASTSTWICVVVIAMMLLDITIIQVSLGNLVVCGWGGVEWSELYKWIIYNYIPFLKLTVFCSWKWMLGIRSLLCWDGTCLTDIR